MSNAKQITWCKCDEGEPANPACAYHGVAVFDGENEMLFWLKRMRKMIETPAHFHSDAYAEMYRDTEELIAKVECECEACDMHKAGG